MTLQSDLVHSRLSAAVAARLATIAAGDRAATPAPEAIGPGPDCSAWTALRELGAAGFDAPAAAGGLELGLTVSASVAGELGRAGLYAPYLAVSLAIDAAAAGEAEVLPALAAGDIAVLAAGFESMEFESALHASQVDGLGWSLEGSIPAEPCRADAVLLPVRLDGTDDLGLVLIGVDVLKWTVLPNAPGATGVAAVPGVLCEPAALLCRLAPETGCAEGPLGRARVRQAAYLAGLAHGALAATVTHAGTRRQFGQRLRDFQAVQFRLAEAHVSVEAVELLVKRAAWLADAERRFALEATEALALAAEVALSVTRLAMQVGGARAMTSQLPAHRYYLRTRLEAVRLGRPDQLWRAAGSRRMTDRMG
ncbi:MAG TPA: acyl-CoA dehydrogenase family protein [Micromonosporaceae bacterium]|nr:acyl-CoA dehydrogenase family protein [Micromonosporaceae bacterium]